jgi:signal transduction histidine kinase
MEDPVRAVEALQDLALDLLEADWTIGRGNEAALAARAIELVEDRASKDWLGRNRGRLEDRTRQLFWAEQLFDELRPLQSEASGLSGESGEFFYRAGRRAHWAGTWWGGDFYAFALDRSGLEADLRGLCAQAITGTEHIDMSVVPPAAEPPSLALARRSLSPFLPGWSLSAHLRNEQAIANLQARRTRQQMAIVLLALLMIITGSVVTARMVGREMEVARVKADFAANVSHELRSPITQIRLKGESLQFGLPANEEELIEHYDVIVQESERLSRLVDNVLDFSAIERGAKRYDLRPADLIETVRAAVEAARFTMETRGLDMAFTVPEGLPVVLHDPEAIGQVIQNLISNAAKYGLKGGWIGVSGGVGQRTVDISVSDKGMGISAEDLPQIFHKFYRSSNPLARMQKGTGIGLTIVQYIMNAHGGSVSVKSSEGIGTTFTLHFPIRSPTHSGL